MNDSPIWKVNGGKPFLVEKMATLIYFETFKRSLLFFT